MTNVDNFLEHYGVKGMRWGVRRSAKQLRRASAARASRPEVKVKKMSDKELTAALQRMRLEREYVQISKTLEPPSAVKSLLSKHGGQAASIVVGTATSALVGAAIKRAFDKQGVKTPKMKDLKDNVKNISFN